MFVAVAAAATLAAAAVHAPQAAHALLLPQQQQRAVVVLLAVLPVFLPPLVPVDYKPHAAAPVEQQSPLLLVEVVLRGPRRLVVPLEAAAADLRQALPGRVECASASHATRRITRRSACAAIILSRYCSCYY